MIDPDDSLEKICRTLLTQIGLGLALTYALHVIKTDSAEGPTLLLYDAILAMLALFAIGIMYAAMSLKVYYSLSKWLDEKILSDYPPSFLLILATLMLNLIAMFVPIVAGYQVLHFARTVWE